MVAVDREENSVVAVDHNGRSLPDRERHHKMLGVLQKHVAMDNSPSCVLEPFHALEHPNYPQIEYELEAWEVEYCSSSHSVVGRQIAFFCRR